MLLAISWQVHWISKWLVGGPAFLVFQHYGVMLLSSVAYSPHGIYFTKSFNSPSYLHKFSPCGVCALVETRYS